MKKYIYFHVALLIACIVHFKYIFQLLSEKVKITNDGMLVPTLFYEAIPYWFSQGYYEDPGLFFSVIILIPVMLWSFFTAIDMLILYLRMETRAHIFND